MLVRVEQLWWLFHLLTDGAQAHGRGVIFGGAFCGEPGSLARVIRRVLRWRCTTVFFLILPLDLGA